MGPNKVPKNAHQRNQKLSKFVFFFRFLGTQKRAILKTYKSTFGTQNGPGFLQKIPKRFTRETKMSPRGPSWALKSLFKNLKKTYFFARFWVQRPPKRASRNPRAAQEAPKELQRPMQKIAKKNPQKWLHGKKCLKPAISFRTSNGSPFWWLFLLIFKLIVGFILDYCLNLFETHFGSHGGWKPAKERSKWLKTPIKGIKNPKSSILKKTFKKTMSFSLFLTTKASQECL